VHAVAGLAKEMTVGSAKNVAHDIKCLLTVGMHPHVAIFGPRKERMFQVPTSANLQARTWKPAELCG